MLQNNSKIVDVYDFKKKNPVQTSCVCSKLVLAQACACPKLVLG
jgi:hypothetical protein